VELQIINSQFMIILLVGIALSAMVSTHQINITNIYPVVNE